LKVAYIGIDFLINTLHVLLKEKCEIIEIFTCKTDNKTEFNTEVIAMAAELGVPCQLEPIRREDLKRLKEKGVELIICAGYYHKVPIETFIPIVNVHPALLPIGRGAWPMPVTILKGLSTSGVTLHKMTEEMDMGDIILKKSFKVDVDENLRSFMKKVAQAIDELIPLLVSDFERLYSNAEPQGDGEYWAMPTEENWTVTPDMELQEIDRIFRAFYGYECIWKEEGKKYELIGARISNVKTEQGICFRKFKKKYIMAEQIMEIEKNV
jgi:methionyl-tRNA formyltransferase